MISTPKQHEFTGFKRRRPLVLEVRDELERMILEGEVPGGERLNEHTLAAQMGVSRAPVREAARSLERDGLVTTVAKKGVFVRKLSVKDALELYDLRAMLAGILCACVARRCGADAGAALRAQVESMSEAIEARDEESYFAQNLAFHDWIAEAADTKRTAALYIALGKEVRLFRHRVLTGQDSLRVSNLEHERIVTAIEMGDVEAAREAGSVHHLNGKARLLDLMGGSPEETA
ncbi:GntR family transcriptional regulator [Actibacterium pelagium]|nr:GntR family transcriptional regulator [Actibacterium pelagium]